MGKFDGILFCTDLDGTIYKNDKTISKRNKDAIEYFKSEGGRFTFITGRLPYYTGYAYNSINPNAPFGCINGGGVYDGESKRYIWTQELSHEALELVKHIDESFSEVGVQICCFDKTYFAVENSTTIRFREITGLPALFCDYRTFTEPIAKIIWGSAHGKVSMPGWGRVKSCTVLPAGIFPRRCQNLMAATGGATVHPLQVIPSVLH